MNNHTDEEFRAMMAESPVPEHTDGFRDRLELALEEEPELETESKGRGIVLPFARRNRRFLASGGATAVAAAVVVALATTNGFNGAQVAGPQDSVTTAVNAPTDVDFTLASQIIEAADAKYSEITSLQGRVVVTTPQGQTSYDQSFAYRVSDGSFHYTEGGSIQTYNGTLGVQLSDNGGSLSLNRNVEPGFVPLAFSPYDILQGLSLDGNAAVKDTTVNGREAYEISATTDQDIIGLGIIAPTGLNAITATFDRESLYPLTIDAAGYHTEVLDLKLNEELPESLFDTSAPADTPMLYDAGFVRSTDAEVLAAVPDAVLPATPAGWAKSTLTYNQERGAYTQYYSRGLQVFSVDGYMNPENTDYWTGSPDYTQNIDTANTAYETYELEGGALAGAEATITTNFAYSPYIRIPVEAGTVYIAGSMSVDDLKAFADSLAPLG